MQDIIRKKLSNGVDYLFLCDTKSSSEGFTHRVEMARDYIPSMETTLCVFEKAGLAHWINRTWESFRFQTAILNCINKNKKYMDETEYNELYTWLNS